jgi:hypothetical protein
LSQQGGLTIVSVYAKSQIKRWYYKIKQAKRGEKRQV